MKKLLLSLALLCVAAGTIQAQDVYQWFGAGPDRAIQPPTTDWNAGGAWMTEIGAVPGSYGTVPGPNAKVKINNVLWGTNWEQWSPVVSTNVTVGDVFLVEGPGLSPEYLTVASGATLDVIGAGGTAEGQINIGYAGGATEEGTLFVNGTINVSGPVHVGWGGIGHVVIGNGGALNAAFIDIGGNLGSGSIAVNGGTMVIKGFQGDLLQGYVDNGQLTANGSADNVVITYDEANDQTIVTPEPVSIALMGLGALLLRKRS